MEKLIRPVFTLELNQKILPGLVCIGKYDGTHPCITAATTADKILIHSPHRRSYNNIGRIIWSESNKEIATLNINQKITALTTGSIIPDDDKDILIVGMETNVLAYHVHDNRDLFYIDCPDSVKSLTTGSFGSYPSIVLIGGNSSVYGYDHQGNELFWTTVGDVVSAMILTDYNKDGSNELIVGSEDYKIRVLKGDQVVSEINETEIITFLANLQDGKFAYGVSNGTLGVYEMDSRLWRVKSKNFAIAVHFYDLIGISTPQLITGWSNGKIDCRSVPTGEVLFKDAINCGIAGVVEGDYRSIGKTDIIIVSSEGEIRGYTTTKAVVSIPGTKEEETVKDLLAQKQALIMELRHYENNAKYNENILGQTDSYENHGVVPANTRLQIALSSNMSSDGLGHVEVYITTNNATIIRSVIVFAEGIFNGETLVVHPAKAKLKSDIAIPLFLPKDNPIDIHIKALVGYPNSIQFHVFEITRQLPRFSMYSLIDNPKNRPTNGVHFHITERLQRICIWLNQNFLLQNEFEYEGAYNLTVNFRNLRDGSELVMVFEIGGKVSFLTDNMALASDLVQSLCGFLNLDELDSKAAFRQEEDCLKELMEKLSDIQEARLRLGTDVADRLGQIRTLVLRAEDSRLNNIKEMPSFYQELNLLNKEMINGYNVRLQNYNEGVETMKKINGIIQRASRLRYGAKSANLIANCRSAIKNNNLEGLIRIIENGE